MTGVTTLLGTAAIILLGNRLAAGRVKERPHRQIIDDDDEETYDEETLNNETQKLIILRTGYWFYCLRKRGYSFTDVLATIQQRQAPPPAGAQMFHRTEGDLIDQDHMWLKIWCYIGGTLNESEQIPGGCTGTGTMIRVGRNAKVTEAEIIAYAKARFSEDEDPEDLRAILKPPGAT